MHDILFEATPKTKEQVVAAAEQISGIDLKRLTTCIDTDPLPADRIAQDMAQAKALHLEATPGFVLGHVDTDNRVILDKAIIGAQPFHVFQTTINEILAKREKL